MQLGSLYVAYTPPLSIFYDQLISKMGYEKAIEFLNQTDHMIFVPINDAWTEEFMESWKHRSYAHQIQFFKNHAIPVSKMNGLEETVQDKMNDIAILKNIKTINGYIVWIEKGLESPPKTTKKRNESYTGFNPFCWI